jgi:hypothetical protein
VFLYPVDFVSLNRPTGILWSVSIGADSVAGTSTTLTLHEPNGTFAFNVTTGNRFEVAPQSATVTVAGTIAGASISFALRPGYLTGLITPLSAVVNVDGALITTPGGSFNATLLPGTHSIEATAAGYVAFFANETVTPGNATDVPITLEALPASSPSPSSTALPSWALLGLLLAVLVAGAIVGVAYLVSRRPPTT